jgi:hypothetical protein
VIVLEMQVSGADDGKLIMKIIYFQKDSWLKLTLEIQKLPRPIQVSEIKPQFSSQTTRNKDKRWDVGKTK